MIGAGQMTEALVGGLLASQVVEVAGVWATDISPARCDVIKQRFGIRTGADNREAASWADIIVLAVKPQTMDTVLADLAPVVEQKLLISVAAGIPLSRLAAAVPSRTRLVRVMPNAPTLVREGATALAFGPNVAEEDCHVARTMFEAVGRAVIVDEHLMAAVTGLSGSGPAYIFMAIEALADGGVKMGLSRSVAELLAAQTVLGAARMLIETGEHPGRLKDRVASPGGTTIAGLHRLEQGRLRATLIDAVEAATKRAEELGRQSD
ncbi:MAG TPA: pyrroline-5-carboxylate reductase [Nitrospiraceae bacterium]|nr:pyrroline-5-carboxylate reductase [Nitrospiraceae bacterium]